MLKNTLLVVSDKFHDFSAKNGVITASKLHHLLTTKNQIFPANSRIALIPGQGFGDNSIKKILALAKTARNSSFFDFTLMNAMPKRACKTLTHKHQIENILVSTPSRLSESAFIMEMLIDEDCEMMRDHQTGLHIQGMLLVEAARQGYLAVMEKYFLHESEQKNYFIFNKLNVDYSRFAFPLPASLRVEHSDINFSNPKNRQTITNISIMQCDTKAASISMDVTIMPEKRVSLLETRLANQTIDNHMNTLLNNTPQNEANYKWLEHA